MVWPLTPFFTPSFSTSLSTNTSLLSWKTSSSFSRFSSSDMPLRFDILAEVLRGAPSRSARVCLVEGHF